MAEEQVVVLLIWPKEKAFQKLSEQLVHATLSGLLSETEATKMATDLITTEPDTFLSIELEDVS